MAVLLRGLRAFAIPKFDSAKPRLTPTLVPVAPYLMDDAEMVLEAVLGPGAVTRIDDGGICARTTSVEAVVSPGPPVTVILAVVAPPGERDACHGSCSELASACEARIADEGADVIGDAVQWAMERAADALARAREDAYASAPLGAEAAAPESGSGAASEARAAVVVVDHMRGGKRYTRALDRHCASCGVEGVLLAVARSEPREAAAPADGPPARPAASDGTPVASLGHCADGAHEALLMGLLGAPSGVSEVLRRWRSEPIDTDSRGRACLERKTRVVADSPVTRAAGASGSGLSVTQGATMRDVASMARWLGLPGSEAVSWVATADRGVKLR